MRKIFFSLLALMMAAFTYAAADFTAVCSSGQTLAYKIVDAGALTCEVTEPDTKPTGEVTIDATVVNPNDSKTYTVIGVGTNAFYEAQSLTKVTFPTAATFTYIGKAVSYDHAFRSSGLTGKLIIPDNVTQIGGTAFYQTNITEIQWGTGVTKIGPSAFYNCRYLTHVELPDAVTSIGSTSFASCYNMTYFQMGTGMANVVSDALSYNDKLDTIVVKATTPPTVTSSMPSSLTSSVILYVPSASVEAYKAHAIWGEFKFIAAEGTPVNRWTLTMANMKTYGINGRSYVNINGTDLDSGKSIKCANNEVCHVELEPQKFWAMQSVKLNDTDITSQFTDNKADVTITEDATLTVTWYQPVPPYDFTETVQSGQLLYFTITDAVNHKVKIVNQSGGRGYLGSTDVGYMEWNETDKQWQKASDYPKGDLIIPATIQHENVTYTIEEVDTMAFVGTGITSVAFTEGLKQIGAAAFYECGSLKGSVFVPMSCTSVGEWCFRGTKITELSTGGAEELPEYLTLYAKVANIRSTSATKSIRNYFQSSNYYLKTVEIGENVERVGSYAFYGCNYVTKVISYATTPPQMKNKPTEPESDSWGYWSVGSMTLYVPKGSKAAYEAAKCWKLFGTITELKDVYTITTAISGTGLGGVLGGGNYEEGTDTALTAVPATHYQFVKWSDGNTDNPRKIKVTGNATYTAEFAPRPTQVGDILEMMDHGQTVRYEVISVKPNELKLIRNNDYYRNIASDWTIPGTVKDYWGETFQLTRLGSICLYSNYGIDTLRIPEGVRVVESSALYYSEFRKWYFPSTIDSIYNNNATYCNRLEDIRFAGTNNLRFADFSTLCSETSTVLKTNTPNNSFCVRDGVALFYKGSAPAVLDVPEGVKILAERPIYYASLYSVEVVRLPSSLKRIGELTFVNLQSACKTIYVGATNPPVIKDGTVSYMSAKKIIVPCDANLEAYKAHAYWSTAASIVAGTQFVPTVSLVNSYGTYEIKEPTCGTIRIVAKPNTYYVVDEWGTGAKDVDSIDVVMTKDSTITLKFKLESYTVRFLDWDGTEVYPSMKVQRGSNIGSIPTLPNTKTGYTSDYWTRSDGVSDVLGAIWKNVDYTAHYSPNMYTITFKNWNGVPLDSHNQEYDSYVNYYGITPTRPENDTCKYFFKEWSPEFISGTTKVTGDMTFTAVFDKSYKSYTVTFKNWNGDELDKQEGLHLGDVLTYKGQTPTKPYTDEYVYTFIGWNNGFVDGVTKVSKDISTYIAQFEQKANAFTITFLNYDDSELDKQTLRYDDDIVYKGEEPKRDADKQYIYTFDTWDPVLPLGAKVTGDATYKATYKTTLQKYTVTFLAAEGGAKLDEKEVVYGSDATSVAPDITAITPADKQFDRWSEDITNVQDNMTVWPLWKDKTALRNVEADTQATKFMQDGKLFIRRGEKIYNANGAVVR